MMELSAAFRLVKGRIAMPADILSLVADILIGVLADRLSDNLRARLHNDSSKNAFKQALGAAIQRYAAAGSRLDLARPLLQKDGPLTDPVMATQLAQLISFTGEPDLELVGQRWQAAVVNPPRWRNFTEEARLFVGYLQTELRATEVFRPVFDARSIDAIAAGTTASTESLAKIETQLADLTELMAARFADLVRMFSAAPAGIHDQIRDYTGYIEEKTHGFIGRRFVFDAIDQFIAESPRGYFIVRGDPGIGKSALATQLVKMRGWLHHFNIRANGISRAESFLRNICAQLIAAYELDHSLLPIEASQDAGFLSRLLSEVSDRLQNGKKVIIVVDALDEADNFGLPAGANTLYLPVLLPCGVYMVVTTRKAPLSLRIECEQRTLDIEQDAAGNIADIRTYVEREATRQGIQAYIAAQAIGTPTFVSRLVEKSQGNFMYLRYVLPEIERGVYKDMQLEALPAGLRNYYENHWRRMRGQDEQAWFGYKLPVVMALTVVKDPVSIDLIVKFSGVPERSRIRSVLDEWAQFLHEEQVEHAGEIQKRYRVYHASFHDFITEQEEIADERVSRKVAHQKIAETLRKKLYSDRPLPPAPGELRRTVSPIAQPVQPEEVLLTLHFTPHGKDVHIIWVADVLGRRSSLCHLPFDNPTQLLVIRALDAAQWPNHPRGGPQFSQSEHEQLAALGLWGSDRIAADIHQRVGRALYAALTTNSVGDTALHTVRDYATAEGLPLTYLLRFPPDAASLAALPWEVLWDERGPLLLSRGKLAACIRYLDLDQALPPPASTDSVLRILAIAPHAQIPPDVRAEEHAARNNAWADLEQTGLVAIEELSPATPAALVDRIQARPAVDIVHFYGHGRYRDGAGALLLDAPGGSEVWLGADRLAALLSDVRLVMLHACQSAMIGDAGLLTGVGPALSAAGVPAVVGMQLTVRIAAATRFAAVFYRSIAHGDSVQRAVSQARQALYVEEPDGASWYIPTLTIRARDIGPLRLVQPRD
jgi:hypothetical protein